jgi:hypothetical protein
LARAAGAGETGISLNSMQNIIADQKAAAMGRAPQSRQRSGVARGKSVMSN